MSEESRWLPLPTSSSPRLWIRTDDQIANGLRLYAPYSAKGRLLKSLLTACPQAMLRRLSASRYCVNTMLDIYSRQIASMIDAAESSFSFSMGTPGPHNKMTAQVSRHGQPVAYAKIATTSEAACLLAQERTALDALAHLDLGATHIPKVLGFNKHETGAILCQSAANGITRTRPLRPTLDDARFIHALITATRATAGIDDLIKTIFTNAPIGAEAIRKQAPKTWKNALDYLSLVFSGMPVATAFGHGDYAPWNTLLLADGSLYVFDWEYGGKNKPALNDILHYLFMPSRLIHGRSPRESIRELTSIANHPIFGAIIKELNIGADQIPAYILIYLITQAVRQCRVDQPFDPYILECVHQILILDPRSGERRRLLVAAYAFDPDEGSEPGVGWQMVNAIAERNDVWVVTRKNNSDSISRHLAEHPNPALNFIYVDLPKWASFWKRGGRGIRTYYYLWQLLAAAHARQAHTKIVFDLAHHVTFVNDWMYTFLALVPVPFIWGPIGSHPPIPWSLRMDYWSWTKDHLRTWFQAFMRIIDPLFWLSIARARTIIGISATTLARFPIALAGRQKLLSHTAIGVEHLPQTNRNADPHALGFTVISIGRLVPIKGFHLTLMAFSKLQQTCANARLVIIGKGPLKKSLQSLAGKLGIANRVEFVDWLTREDVLEQMRAADAFLFPSFEGGGMVVLEAMASGLPVVCLDYGGPGEMVAAHSGFRIPLGTLEHTVEQLAKSLLALATNPALLREYSHAALAHAQNVYLWSNRGRTIEGWYRNALQCDR